jgi:hypothetical protein
MRLDQAARSIFLTEFIQAFFLSMRYFFKPKATINYPFEKTRYRRVSAGSMYCAAIPTARSAASPASSVKQSVRRRPSPSRPARAGTTALAVPRAMTLIWSNVSIADCARRRPALLTPSSRVRISNTPPKRARSFTTIRSGFWRTATAGSGRSPRTSRSTRLIAETSCQAPFAGGSKSSSAARNTHCKRRRRVSAHSRPAVLNVRLTGRYDAGLRNLLNLPRR